jgi:hypothetical protein
VADLAYQIEIESTRTGYFAKVKYVGAGQDQVLALCTPPRMEVHPSQFYRNRKEYRDFLIRDIEAELQKMRYENHKPGTNIILASAEATMAGYPEGFPGASDDDMADL